MSRKREFIGLPVVVAAATDPSVAGLQGTVVDETMNTFVIRGGGRDRRVPKRGARFRFPTTGSEIAGDEIRFRPEDRVKKAR
jgi:ribonuclease P protein subunit POP4